MRGRKAKPTAIKKMQGNPGKRKINAGEPQAEAVRSLRVPRGRLGKHAARLWKDLAPMLDRIGVLKETDLAALEILCTHYGFAVAAGEAIREVGMVYYDESGFPKKNPAVQVFRENAVAFRMMCGEFGLTPSSRGRLDVAAEEDLDLAAELFNLVGE